MTDTITLDTTTQRFFQGAAVGSTVNEGHAGTTFEDLNQQRAFYWFYVGALAAGEYGCKSAEDLGNFMLGAATREPHEDDE